MSKINKKINIVCKARLKKYFNLTSKALSIVKKSVNRSDNKKKKEAEVIIDMAQRYYNDALWFEKKENYVNAFACLNYAHGWLDCGSKLGLFKVKDSKLFVLK